MYGCREVYNIEITRAMKMLIRLERVADVWLRLQWVPRWKKGRNYFRKYALRNSLVIRCFFKGGQAWECIQIPLAVNWMYTLPSQTNLYGQFKKYFNISGIIYSTPIVIIYFPFIILFMPSFSLNRITIIRRARIIIIIKPFFIAFNVG